MLRVILFFSVLFSLGGGVAAEALASGAEAGVSGELRARARHDDANGREPINRVQDRYVLNGYVSFGKQDCYSVKVRAATGSRFNSVWNDTSLSDGDRDGPFNLRNAWFGLNCIGSSRHIEFGDIRAISTGEFGANNDGWVDLGVRYVENNEATGVSWVVTAGGIDPDGLEQPDLFSRNHGDYNYAQFHLTKKYQNKIKTVADLSVFDSSVYFRTSNIFPVDNYSDFIDHLNVDVLFVESNLQGYLVRIDKTIKEWIVQFGITDRREFRGKEGSERLPDRGFLGNGENFQFIFGKKNALGPVDFRFRARKGDAPFRFEVDFRYRFNWVDEFSY